MEFDVRTFSRSSTAIFDFEPAASSSCSGRRKSILKTTGCPLGGVGLGTSTGHRGLSAEENPAGKEVECCDKQQSRRRSITKPSKETESQSQGEVLGDRELNLDPFSACPLTDKVSGAEACSPDMKLPGELASTVKISAMVNSLPRWISKTKGSLCGFLQKVVSVPKGQNRGLTSLLDGAARQEGSLWPMPVPFPEVFTKKVDSEWEKKLVSLQVIVLSWLCLGGPRGAPAFLCLGGRLSAEQWSVVSYLRHLNRDGNTPNEVDSGMMGRAAAKFESLEAALSSLHRGVAFLHDLFKDSSFGPVEHSRPARFDDSWLRSGSIVGRFEGEVLTTAKPIVADRLGFPGPPSFDPVPFFDRATAEVFLRPLDHALPPDKFDGDVPRVKINATQGEKISLFKKLSACGRLSPVESSKVRGHFVSGLFSVGKNALVDRLILDARPPNLLEAAKTFWCGSMAAGSCITDLVSHPKEALVATGLDLKDYFYQFIISKQRVERNILSGSISLSEAKEVFGPDFEWPEKKISTWHYPLWLWATCWRANSHNQRT